MQFRIKDRVEFVNHIAEGEFEFYEQNKLIYPEITEILQKLKPDFFIYDQVGEFNSYIPEIDCI